MKEKSSIRIIDIHIEFPQDQDPNKTNHHSSMVSTVACYRGGPGFKYQQARELLILNKKEKCSTIFAVPNDWHPQHRSTTINGRRKLLTLPSEFKFQRKEHLELNTGPLLAKRLTYQCARSPR